MTSWTAFDGDMCLLLDDKENCVAIVSRPLFRTRGDPEQYMAYWRGNGTKAPAEGIAPRIPDYNTVYPTLRSAQSLCERYAIAVEGGTVGRF